MRRFVALAAFLCLAGVSHGQIVINEFVYDDQSTDNREFVEIYNAGPVQVDISGYTLQNYDAGGTSVMGTVVVPTGTILNAGAFYLFGNTAVVGANQVIPNDSLENDQETIVLRDNTGAILDTASYETYLQQAGNPPVGIPVEGVGIWGTCISQDATLCSWSRWVDGADTNNNGRDFGYLPATPGAPNIILSSALPYAQNFDVLTLETPVTGWSGSFVLPTVVNPTAASTRNPNPVPSASPQGGQAMVCMDPSGGGDGGFLVTTPTSDFTVEAYVWLDTSRAGADYEMWGFGCRGTADPFFNLPSPNPPNGIANTNTGIQWTYLSYQGGGTLRLVDEGSGGSNETVLATYTITPGVNDGWQRLRITVSGDVVEAFFGGLHGSTNTGTRTLALTNTAGQLGTVYCGYREFVVNNATLRPFMIDDLVVYAGVQPFSTFLTSPSAGFIALENRGLTVGTEVYNVFSAEACPGGVGTGPYLGLCSSDLNFLLAQVLLPLGTAPFHYAPAGATFSFGPLPVTPPLYLEGVAFEFTGGFLSNVASVTALNLP